MIYSPEPFKNFVGEYFLYRAAMAELAYALD